MAKKAKKRATKASPTATRKKKTKKTATRSTTAGKKKTKKKTAKKASKKGKSKKKTSGRAAKTSTKSLPKVGDKVKWRALPGMVEGEVVAILKKDSELNGKKFKASAAEPRIKLKSLSSGKLCIHKPENVSPV